MLGYSASTIKVVWIHNKKWEIEIQMDTEVIYNINAMLY